RRWGPGRGPRGVGRGRRRAVVALRLRGGRRDLARPHRPPGLPSTLAGGTPPRPLPAAPRAAAPRRAGLGAPRTRVPEQRVLLGAELVRHGGRPQPPARARAPRSVAPRRAPQRAARLLSGPDNRSDGRSAARGLRALRDERVGHPARTSRGAAAARQRREG